MLHGPDDSLRTRMRAASSQEKPLEEAGEIIVTLVEQESGISLTAVSTTEAQMEESEVHVRERASVTTFASSDRLHAPKLRDSSVSSVETLVDREGRRSDRLYYEPDDISLSPFLTHQS